MLVILIVVVGLAVAIGVISLFVRWEREGKEQLIPLVLLGLLVLDGTIYSDPNMVPRGLFHPGSGATQLRLPEVYITLALIARLIAKGRPTRIGLPAALWLAFGGWLFVGMIEGKLYGNPFSQDIYEAKDILYIVGAYALAAGVPVRKYFERGDLYKLGTLSVVCATVLDLMQIGGVTVNTNLPLLPLQDFGGVGAETAALFLAIGLTCFLTRLATGPVKVRHVLALVPVIVSVVLANQRAVLVNLARGGPRGARGRARRARPWSSAALSRPGRTRGVGAARLGGDRHRRGRRSRRAGPAGTEDPARLDLRQPLPQRGKG